MKKMIGLALAFSLLSLPAARTVRADEMDDMASKMVGIVEKIADVMVADKANCDKMAKDVNGIVDDNAQFMKDAQEKRKNLTQEQKDGFKKKYGDRLQGAMKKMMDGGQNCQNSDALKAAMQKFGAAAGR